MNREYMSDESTCTGKCTSLLDWNATCQTTVREAKKTVYRLAGWNRVQPRGIKMYKSQDYKSQDYKLVKIIVCRYNV